MRGEDVDMELLFEIIGTLSFEACFEIISNEKVKPIYRKLMLGVVTLFYSLLIYGFGYIAVKSEELIIKLFFIAIIVLLFFFLMRLWINVYKKKPFKKFS